MPMAEMFEVALWYIELTPQLLRSSLRLLRAILNILFKGRFSYRFARAVISSYASLSLDHHFSHSPFKRISTRFFND